MRGMLCLRCGNSARDSAVRERDDGDEGAAGVHAGRNDPCPCGSGVKFKKCCMRANDKAGEGERNAD